MENMFTLKTIQLSRQACKYVKKPEILLYRDATYKNLKERLATIISNRCHRSVKSIYLSHLL